MKKCLLVVDDDPSVRKSLKRVLDGAGYYVLQASDGRDAEKQLANPRIDLLILDLNMPHRNGWAVLEDVSAGYPFLPIIVISGMEDPDDALGLPVLAELMQKPIEAPALLHKIEELLDETPEARLSRVFGSLEMDPPWEARTGIRGNPNLALQTLS